MGDIYIATNPGLKAGLIKIGMTEIQPTSKIQSLSRSTSAPADFKLIHTKKVQKTKLVESRVHSVLSNYRFRLNREFFETNVEHAIDIIEKISELTENESEIGTTIGKHSDLIYSNYMPNLTLTELKLMDLIMGQINYHYGELSWLFNENFIKLFSNNKI